MYIVGLCLAVCVQFFVSWQFVYTVGLCLGSLFMHIVGLCLGSLFMYIVGLCLGSLYTLFCILAVCVHY